MSRTATLALASLFAGCAVPRYATSPAPIALSARGVTGPAKPGELEQLARQWNDPVAQLRRGFLLERDGRAEEAVSVLNGVLFGDPQPATIHAFARYLRASAYTALGDGERSRDDFLRARAIPLDGVERARIESSLFAKRPGIAPAPVVAAATPPNVRPRSAWNARRADTRRMAPMGRVRAITVHHSATQGGQPAATEINAIQRHHMQTRGWSDISYHYLIDRSGQVWTGRAMKWRGAHAGDPRKNQGNIGVCLLGNFMRQPPSDAQLHALERTIDWLVRREDLSRAALWTHRDFKGSTECPGDALHAIVKSMRRLARPKPE